jgi:hypothetical protein
MTTELPERRESLWLLAAAPLMWAAHLLLSYGTAAVWCAKFAGPTGSLDAARLAIGGYTVLGLVGIVLVGWRGYKRHKLDDSPPPHDADSPADRHRFLGYAALLLAGLSAVAVLYQALAAVFIGSCR